MSKQEDFNDEEKNIEERPIGANSDEWNEENQIHEEVNKTIKKYIK